MHDTRIWYTGLVALMVVERLAELLLSARNARRLRARGGVEHGAGHYPLMVILHAALFLAAPAEVFLAGRRFAPWVGLPMIVLLAGTLLLRYWVIATLGDRWCTRVIVPPGEPSIAAGPYRILRHPSYTGAVLAAAGVVITLASVAGLAVIVALVVPAYLYRIRVEEEALISGLGEEYRAYRSHTWRLIPFVF